MTDCIAVFDIGKTNKKFILFDFNHCIVHEEQTTFEEVKDDEGDNCEDLRDLTQWMLDTWQRIQLNMHFNIKALNFTTYGASFVHLDANNRPATPLYNYLKAMPKDIESMFYALYGDALDIATDTASPALGMLNSGLQLYWLKHAHPFYYQKIKTSLHFPQYCSYLFTKNFCSEFTSIGCHTALWHMGNNDYHPWVKAEGIEVKFAPISKSHLSGYTPYRAHTIPVGTGLHDSSAALIPYLKQNSEPFLLLSTGTWCITLNPFAKKLLSKEELMLDCLNYMTFEGKQVKASRLFLGHFHEVFTKMFAGHFFKPKDYYKSIRLDEQRLEKAKQMPAILKDKTQPEKYFSPTDLDVFESYELAYHRLVYDMAQFQIEYVWLAGEGEANSPKKLYIDGGFSKNELFVTLLKIGMPNLEIMTYDNSQGTAFGAALVMADVVKYGVKI